MFDWLRELSDFAASFKTFGYCSSTVVLAIAYILAFIVTQCISYINPPKDFRVEGTKAHWKAESLLAVIGCLASTIQVIAAVSGLMGYLFQSGFWFAIFCVVTLIWMPLEMFRFFCYVITYKPLWIVFISLALIWLSTVFVHLWIVLVAYAQYRQLGGTRQLQFVGGVLLSLVIVFWAYRKYQIIRMEAECEQLVHRNQQPTKMKQNRDKLGQLVKRTKPGRFKRQPKSQKLECEIVGE